MNVKELLNGIWNETEIPKRDKKIHLFLLVLIVSPLDAVPDWIAWYGLIDDVFYFAIIGDFYFNILDSRIFLTHFPSNMKNYAKMKRIFTAFDFLIPHGFMTSFWKYKRDIY